MLSIPAFLGIVMNLLYGFIDGIFIGRGIGTGALGGVSVVFPLTILIVSLATLVGEGLASVVSRAIGRNDGNTAREAIAQGHGLIFWISLIIVALSIPLAKPIIGLTGAPGEILPYGISYYRAMLPGVPFMCLSLVYFHQLNAQGEMRVVMKGMMASTVLNIILDYIAIFILEWGISGAGYATALSQMVWFFYMHFLSLGNKEIYTVAHPFSFPHRFALIREMAAIGFSAFVRQFGVSLGLILINNQAGRYGSAVHISAFGASLRIMRLFIAPIAAISIAVKPIVGQNFGMGAFDRVRETLERAFKSCAILGLILLALMISLRQALGRLFGMDSQSMDIFIRILLITSILFPLIGIQHIIVSYFLSLGRAGEALFLNLLKQVIFLIPLIYILPLFLGINGLFFAIPAADLMTIGFSLLLYKRSPVMA